MIGYLLIAIVVLVAAIVALWTLWRSASKDYARMAARNDTLADELERTRKTVSEVQAVYEKYAKKEDAFAHGSDSERVANSIDVLSDLSRARTPAGTDRAGIPGNS